MGSSRSGGGISRAQSERIRKRLREELRRKKTEGTASRVTDASRKAS